MGERAVLRIRRPGRRGRTDEFYATVAVTYHLLSADGNRHPIETIATEGEWSRDTVAGWIKEARLRGLLLPPAKRRSVGGEVTTKALSALHG